MTARNVANLLPRAPWRARRPLRLTLAGSALALYFALSGYTGCQDSQTTGTVHRGDANTKTVRMAGRTDTSRAGITLQALRDPSYVPDNTASNWMTVSSVRGSTTALTWNDPMPYYDWGPANVTIAHGTVWPLGGVLRMRTMMDTPNGPMTLASFNDDFSLCSQRNASNSWLTIGSACLPRYPRQGITHIVSTAKNPALNLQAYYLERKLKQFDPDNLGAGYYERTGYDIPNIVSTREIHSLSGFKSRYGLGYSDDVVASYYNRGDLGLGREMHCDDYTDGNESGVACYVTNYRGITDDEQLWGGLAPEREQPAVNDAIARRNPLATVTMVYARGAAEPVRFAVYNGRGPLRADDEISEERLLDEARLEYFTSDRSQKLPSNCTACHGGSVNIAQYEGKAGAGALTRAYFLPFDLQAFRFSSSNAAYSRASQEEAFRKLNALVLTTNVPQRIKDLVNGWYGGNVNAAGRKFDDNYVPPGWRNSSAVPFAEDLYKNVYEPYCQGCHISQHTYGFETALSFVQAKALIIPSVCGNATATNAPGGSRRMPHAEATLNNFWNSGARAHLMAALDARGACN